MMLGIIFAGIPQAASLIIAFIKENPILCSVLFISYGITDGRSGNRIGQTLLIGCRTWCSICRMVFAEESLFPSFLV